ncbi:MULTISPECIES: flagellar hook capping FlgD N-terminal domain-containing protein [Clostridium]|uniref:flagellar hook capping FlgD N-terminal domain-containing protein n=1 Tax=Clostridium TaxID=1485 RepID=UPI000824BD65|nr:MULTISPECIES: flagellar hook capping FlgD N-terminal domain-containing protein [Clostridium]PJI09871.1 flagellar biosynthesis protein FlgD [Clostridium sp. CT7]
MAGSTGYTDINSMNGSRISASQAQALKNSSSTSSKTNSISGLDQNAFLKILVAELQNQDPTNSKDSTEYVAQMAQFSSLQEMLNLNTTMTFNGASSLVGKLVSLSVTDDNGKNYKGIVQNVTRNGNNIKLNVEVLDDNGYPIKQEKRDDKGNIIRDSNGNIEYETTQEPKRDSSGNIVKDDKGNIMYEDVPVNKVLTFNYSDVSSIENGIYNTESTDTTPSSSSTTPSSSSTTPSSSSSSSSSTSSSNSTPSTT